MSLKNKVLIGLCKDVLKSEKNNNLRSFLSGLLRTKGYDYYSRQIHLQFTSILNLNLRREELIKKGVPLDIQVLTPEEIKRLEELQDDLIQMNIECIEHALGDSNTPLRDALVPYTFYNIPLTKKNRCFHFLKKEIVNDVKEEFSKTAAIEFLKKNVTILKNLSKAGGSEISNSIHLIQQEINNAGFGKVPSFLDELRGPVQLNDTHKAILSSLALVVIRKQLEIMNQLVYQACLSDRLVSFDEDNIFHIESQSSNYLSKTLQISTEFGMEASVLALNDVVLVNLENLPHPLKSIYLTWGVELTMNRELGSQINLKLLELDDDLNPYGNIFGI